MSWNWKPLVLALCAIPGYGQDQAQILSLEASVMEALAKDPWLEGSALREHALSEEAVSAGALPDPKLNLVAGNLPTDSWDINQEAMTRLGVGLSQAFPRGDSLALRSRQKLELADGEPFRRADREAKVRASVSQLWLDVFETQGSMDLLEADRSLFDQLADAARASYATASGRARQQDLVRAQLELTRLDDRLTILAQRRESSRERLSEWIGDNSGLPLPSRLPEQSKYLRPLLPAHKTAQIDRQVLYELVRQHPALGAIDQRIEATQTAEELARQKYKPAWSLSANYGYRADDLAGVDRADLFSIGVNLDLPLFTANRQDRDVSAAISRTGALRTDRQLLARRLVSELDDALAQLQRLDERKQLYEELLLPQMSEQAEASLNAYNNDDGDFSEAVRARIDELDARIEALVIAVDTEKVFTTIDYLLAGRDEAISPVTTKTSR